MRIRAAILQPRPAVVVGVVLSLTALGAAGATRASAAVVETMTGESGAAIHGALLAHRRDGFSGAVVAAVDGEPVLEAGYGLANRAAGQAFTVDTVAQIGSITKAFTALAVIDLALADRLDLDAPVSRYLPAASAPARHATVHQLLTHSSGMPEYCGDDFDPLTLDALLAECMSRPLRFDPGAGVGYSNAGYSVLAAIVEAVSDRDLEAYLRDTVLEPNGLGTVGYRPPEGAAPAHGYLDGHDQGSVSRRIERLAGDFWALKGNGGMQASAHDMFGLYEALAGRRALGDDHAAVATEPRVESRDGIWEAYGWIVVRDDDGATVQISFAGSDGTFYSYFWWDPREDRFFYLVGNAGEQRTVAAVRDVRRIMRR